MHDYRGCSVQILIVYSTVRGVDKLTPVDVYSPESNSHHLIRWWRRAHVEEKNSGKYSLWESSIRFQIKYEPYSPRENERQWIRASMVHFWAPQASRSVFKKEKKKKKNLKRATCFTFFSINGKSTLREAFIRSNCL